MKKLLILALILAALLSSCGRETAPAAVAATIETATETTTETSATAPPSLPEPPSEISAVPIATATAAETTARITLAAHTVVTAQTVTAMTTASTTVIKTTAAAKSTAARYVYTNTHTTTTRAGTSTAPSAAADTAPTLTAYNAPLASASARRTEAAVSFAIDGSAAVPYGYNVSLPAQSMVLNGGESVLDLLKRSGVAMQSRGSGTMAYLSGIGGLQEKACGGASGWVYEVNGARPPVSCGAYQPKDGDVIVWKYTLNG